MALVKKLLANARDVRDDGSIPKLGRSPGGWHGNPFQYFCLENPTEEPGRPQFIGSGLQRVRHDWVTEHIAHHPMLHCLEINSADF